MNGCGVPQPTPIEPPAVQLMAPELRDLVARKLAAARAEPRDPSAHGELGMVYEANALWAEARESYRLASTLEPGNRTWRYRLAVAAEQSGEPELARELLTELTTEDQSFAPAQYRLGLAHLHSGEPSAALEAFEAVRSARPRVAEGHAGAGAALRRLNRLDDAVASLRRALELDPADSWAHHELGLALRDLGRPRAAADHLARGVSPRTGVLRDDSWNRVVTYAVGPSIAVERAESLRARGDLNGAGRVLAEALSHRPDNLTLLNHLAAVELSLGNLDEARSRLDRALSLGGEKAETLLNLAGWAMASNNPGEAVRWADRGLSVAATAPLYALRGQALIQQHRYDDALTSLESALQLEVRDPGIYLALGVLYEATGRWPAALELYDRALDRWPTLPPALAGRCAAALELGDVATARQAFDRLLAVAPADARVAELRSRLAGAS